MIIALDAMGGDFAPAATVEGALLSLENLPSDCRLLLIGKEALLREQLSRIASKQDNRIQIIHADDVIEMGEHPTKALQSKPHSSIGIGFGLLASAKANVFAGAGNTGAMMVGALFSVKSIPGISRPAIAGFAPRPDGSFGVLLDVGANADCKPEMLVQFAIMGSLYAEYVLGKQNPKVALLNIGEEEQKGSVLTQATYQLLKTNSAINFIGNIEGRDLFSSKSDVMVCDGFTGNVVLKMAESFYDSLVDHQLMDAYFSKFNYEEVGGSPILGVNGDVIIGHGISSPKAIKNMILQSFSISKSGVTNHIKQALKPQDA
jgi:glycerol-3-phosphate acyltransferase PlsX